MHQIHIRFIPGYYVDKQKLLYTLETLLLVSAGLRRSTRAGHGDSGGKQSTKHVNYVGSDESAQMNEFLHVLDRWQKKIDSANAILKKDPSQRESINKEMANEQSLFRNKQQSFARRRRRQWKWTVRSILAGKYDCVVVGTETVDLTPWVLLRIDSSFI